MPLRSVTSAPSVPPTTIVYIFLAAAVFSGVVIVGIAPGRTHLHVAGLYCLVLQSGAAESSSVEQNVEGGGGARISHRLPHQKDRRAAGRQTPRGGIRRGAVGVRTAGVVAAGFPHAAVGISRIGLARRGGRQRPVDRPGVDFSNLSPDLNRAAGRDAGGLRGEHLDESPG